MRLVMGLIDLSQRVTFSPAYPLADILHPPYPPIASQSISRDVPFAWARAFRDRALHEHRTSSGSILPISGSTGATSVSFHPFHRARSASEKGACPPRPHPPRARRTESVPIRQFPK